MDNPYGYIEIAKDLEVRRKTGGLARLGDVMRPNQQQFIDLVADYRRKKKRTQFIWFKVRQLVAMSTTVGAVITGDNMSNEGMNAIVTAQDADSLDEISQIYRHFYGRTKKAGVEQGRASRLADRLFVATNGSRTKLQVADEDLGRSGNATAAHVSEAGYLKDFFRSWESLQPALSGAPDQLVVMETTLRRGVVSDVQGIAEEVLAGQHKPWEVHFTSWHANPDLAVRMNPNELAEFMDTCPVYERELVDRHHLSWSQARWYYDTRTGSLWGSYEAMQENYPTTLKEAMASTKGGGFFHAEAIKFYNSCIREPIKRMKPELGRLRDWVHGDSPLQPHVEIWHLPAPGREYIVGADCADADERIAIEGSENAAVLVEKDTGTVCALYHGYSNAHEFAAVMVNMAVMYNEAYINPEFNNAGRAVVDHMMNVLNYRNVCPRETLRHGLSVGVVSGQFGFDTRGKTRAVLLDRLQMGVNNRMWDIPSKYLVKCLVALAKRDGRRVRSDHQNADPDDGAIALALTAFGHTNLVERVWRPKQPYEPLAIKPAGPPKRRGPLIDDDGYDNRPRWDAVSNSWR